jgi:hypothetical protein
MACLLNACGAQIRAYPGVISWTRFAAIGFLVSAFTYFVGNFAPHSERGRSHTADLHGSLTYTAQQSLLPILWASSAASYPPASIPTIRGRVRPLVEIAISDRLIFHSPLRLPPFLHSDWTNGHCSGLYGDPYLR